LISFSRASRHGVEALSRKLLKLLEDRNSQVYQESITKFGVPEEYVRKAFSKETLLEALDSARATFYLSLENRCKILGFAQTAKHNEETVELDRIVIFPEHAGKGLGTQMLAKILNDQRRKGVKTIVVNAGKDEKLARRFYEKNGFEFVEEKTVKAPWGDLALAFTGFSSNPYGQQKRKMDSVLPTRGASIRRRL
jgi:ribosomal protein S18 acetylase RimI-like enzyme